MAEIVTMMRKGNEHNWGLEMVLKKRKKLMRTVPIHNKEITEIDKWLVTQNLSLRDLIQILARANYCMWAFYCDEASPGQKHQLLLRLRESYCGFQKLPPRFQKKLSPLWALWHSEFLAVEEEEEAANDVA
jgi:hypothetical protein